MSRVKVDNTFGKFLRLNYFNTYFRDDRRGGGFSGGNDRGHGGGGGGGGRDGGRDGGREGGREGGRDAGRDGGYSGRDSSSGGRFKNSFSMFERPYNTKHRVIVEGISSSTDWRVGVTYRWRLLFTVIFIYCSNQ